VLVKKGTKFESKYISQLNINDEVLVDAKEGVQTSQVVSFLHKSEDANATFIRLHYGIENKPVGYITLTPKHLLNIGNDEKADFKPASDVKLGDVLTYFDSEKSSFTSVTVFKIETIYKTGVFAPLTKTGTIVVDDILASCYSMVKSHKMAHFFFDILNKIGNVLPITPDTYVSYSKFLYQIIDFIKVSNLFLSL